MDYCQFLEMLLGEGRALVPALGPISAEEKSAAINVLVRYEKLWRQECPGGIPDFCSDAASWAAEQFCLACQFAIFRSVDETSMRSALKFSPPKRADASMHYSVDLVFRFLPDLIKFVHAASSEDPLENILRQWANDWPLSSIGVSGINVTDLEEFYRNRGLMMLYVDRVLSTGDQSRLEDDIVRENVLSAVGMYPELASSLALNNYLNDDGEVT